MTQAINRRSALAVVPAVAAAAVLTTPALASAGEDAELLRLWNEWNAQGLRCKQTYNVLQEIEGKVMHAAGPYWEIAKVESFPARVLLISSSHADDRVKIVPLKAKEYQHAHKLAGKVRGDLAAERERCRKAAQRRYKQPTAERANNLENRRQGEIEQKIAETPAEGLKGIAVKLALWKHYSDGHGDEVEEVAVASVYKTVVNLTGGIDLAAQVERW
jgi:hypothetical protein